MLSELLAGTHPVYAWMDEHPYVALAVFAACAFLSMVVA